MEFEDGNKDPGFLVQGSPAWHEFRSERIGGSDAAPILGISPFLTRFQLWEIKKGLKKQYFSSAMQRGKELEPEARELFEKITGLQVFDSVLTHKKNDWKIGSFDGITLDFKQAVEIKCPGEYTHKMALEGIVPDYYYAQIQHLIDVADLEFMYYFSYHPDYHYALIKVQRNQQFIDMLHEEEVEFLKYLQENEPPPHFKKKYVCKKSDNEFYELEKKWVSEKLRQKEITDNLKDIEQKLEEMASGCSVSGHMIKIDQIERKGPIDYENVLESLGIQTTTQGLEEYRKPSTIYSKITRIE